MSLNEPQVGGGLASPCRESVDTVRPQAELNKINVFPIADGDTGTNMVICLKNPLRTLLSDPDLRRRGTAARTLDAVTTNFAADVLLYGRWTDSGGGAGPSDPRM